MTKKDYVVEMLSDMLSEYAVTGSQLQEWATDIVDGLDMWHEMSGESVATSNRYADIESEKEQVVKKKEQEIEQIERKHRKEIQEWRDHNKKVSNIYQQQIEELKKQIK